MTTVPKFTLSGKWHVTCVKVYDGDTITVIFEPWPGRPHSISCRLAGYNSAEIRSSDQEEKEAAGRAKAELSKLVLNKSFDIEFGDFDKYGRPLATFTVDSKPIAQHMIEGGWGKPYDGFGDKAWH